MNAHPIWLLPPLHPDDVEVGTPCAIVRRRVHSPDAVWGRWNLVSVEPGTLVEVVRGDLGVVRGVLQRFKVRNEITGEVVRSGKSSWDEEFGVTHAFGIKGDSPSRPVDGGADGAEAALDQDPARSARAPACRPGAGRPRRSRPRPLLGGARNWRACRRARARVAFASMRFFLGTHRPYWLGKTRVPLFISRRQLALRANTAKALGPWALDSGGFTELNKYGKWQTSAQTYANDILSYSRNIGRLEWAAPQDWMCEPFVLAKTGKSVAWHIAATVDSVGELRALGCRQVIPVLQGFTLNDYEVCAWRYAQMGFSLEREPIVGVGSVCRRQATDEAAALIKGIIHAVPGIKLHGFGFKKGGLLKVGHLLASADSLAWSFDARRNHPRLPECDGVHQGKCSNCLTYALRWRRRLMDACPSVAAEATSTSERLAVW